LISLTNLEFKNTIEDIVYKDPYLLYFICYKGDSELYPIKRPLIDEQEDCKELSRFNIFNYKAPYERSTHEPYCRFTTPGKKIFKELTEKDICSEMLGFFSEIITDENGIETRKEIFLTRQEFKSKFNNLFTFKSPKDNILERIFSEIKEEYSYIEFPDRCHGYEKKGCKYHFYYILDQNEFFFIIDIQCKCTFQLNKRISRNDIQEWKDYIIECKNCGTEFHISYNFKNFLPIF